MKRRVALVIGAGSVKCAAALGLWKVLAREGVEIDMFVGCSGGSLYAACMALGYDVDECIRRTTQLWNREITARRDWRSLLAAVMPRTFGFDGGFGMVGDAALLRTLEEGFGDRTFADAKYPLHVVATAVDNGQQVTLSEG